MRAGCWVPGPCATARPAGAPPNWRAPLSLCSLGAPSLLSQSGWPQLRPECTPLRTAANCLASAAAALSVQLPHCRVPQLQIAPTAAASSTAHPFTPQLSLASGTQDSPQQQSWQTQLLRPRETPVQTSASAAYMQSAPGRCCPPRLRAR